MASQALRTEVESTEELHDAQQYLTFQVAGETYAIPISPIKEIIEFGTVTSVPMVPSFIRGVINLRGSVVPVIDLASRFGYGVSQTTRRSCIVIVEVNAGEEGAVLGMMVDSVNEVLEIAGGDTEAAPSFGTKIRTEFIETMVRIGEKFIITLDVGRVLSLEEMTQVMAAGAVECEPSGG